jgi:hypothetical protein
MVSENPINIGVCDSPEDKRSCALGAVPTFSPGAFPRKIRKFHGMEVPDFSHRRYRAAEPQPNPSIRSTQKAQGAQKERKRRSEQPFSRAEARRSLGWAGRRDASTFPPCGSSRFPTVPIPISIHFSQRTQRAQRSLDDTPGGSICVHLRHLRLKIRNFHGMENVLSNRRNRTQGVAEA